MTDGFGRPGSLVVALVALGFAGCDARTAQPAHGERSAEPSAKAPADPPRLLLVTLDTTRADRLGCYGDKSAKTPCLDELARRGVLYERAWCAAPITLSSHLTILSGVYPCAHGVRENGAFQVAPDAHLLSEVVQSAGFKTGAFVGCFILDRKFGLDQGFEVYRGVDASGLSGKWGVADRPAGEVAKDAIAFIDTLAPRDRFFLWVHFYDPHSPYEPPGEPPAVDSGAYQREISNCDLELGRILERLKQRELDAGLVVAVTADHGESLHEHHEETHGVFVYDATMHVPLLITPPPAGVAPGTRVRAAVSNADLAVTLLSRLGFDRTTLPDAKTPSLPKSDEEADADRAIYLESLTPYFAHRQHPLRAVVWNGMKYVSTRRPELYSLADDPQELRDLVAERPELVERLAARLAGLVHEHPPLDWESEYTNTSEDLRNLKGLGYAVAHTGGDAFGDPELPDPKDRIGDQGLVNRIAEAMHDGARMLGLDGRTPAGLTPSELAKLRADGKARLEEALKLIEELRAGNPKDPMSDAMLPTALIGLGRYGEAAAVLERVVTTEPRDPVKHYDLSNAYLKTGKKEWAKRELEKCVHLEPRMVWPLRTLVEFGIKERDWPAAAWWLDEVEKAEGQSPADHERIRRTRLEVQQKLDLIQAKPRPPRPLTDSDLLPEGVLEKLRAMPQPPPENGGK